jgi:hypothetical protein
MQEFRGVKFTRRFTAILRRHVVERCIYGVDLDPLAVELCRLSLWIETMDRTLPFSFLDHKIKCGNALIGAWFDQFQHYPVMAWKNREGGDKGHSNGVHFEKEVHTKAIKAFVKNRLAPDLRRFLEGRTLFSQDLQQQAAAVHTDALATLARLHDLPVHDSAERARIYREELVGSAAYRSLKAAMDLWCACWFWPADALEHAPLPTTFAAPPEPTRAIAGRVAARKRFFHWELEFPDVFRAPGSGFDAMQGNPPWDIAKPSSMEFFSNIDPLYRSYGKQEALRYQSVTFGDAEVERGWLDYNADFRAQSNYMGYAASPFGDPAENDKSRDRFAIARGRENDATHARWRDARAKGRGFADPAHPFRHQGSADLNLYKGFLEQVHALLRMEGRLGFIVPSGLYSDHGTGGLRQLFLDRCRWEWLFSFINWNKIFPPIYYRFKFNALVVQKGGTTKAVNTAFVRTRLEDWERAEVLATTYTRAQVERFSPRSKAIFEIQSQRDLQILEKIYANSVLLGDDSSDGWGIKYATEFHMTNDSKLFPPRPKWEADGYRPDEYSRWLQGDWRPIGELWAELGVKPLPEGDRRCAQPPYDTLLIPRADIPAGVILSREADAWVREDRVGDVALPLYEGRMIDQFDFSCKGWVSGKGRTAVWNPISPDRKYVSPQFLMSSSDALNAIEKRLDQPRLSFIDVASATNARTAIGTLIARIPCGGSAPTLTLRSASVNQLLQLLAIFNSIVADFVFRFQVGGLHLKPYHLESTPVPNAARLPSTLSTTCGSLALVSQYFAPEMLSVRNVLNDSPIESGPQRHALTPHERMRKAAVLNAVAAFVYGVDYHEMAFMLTNCCLPIRMLRERIAEKSLPPNGFWRVDKDKDPELRHTILSLVAFHDLEEKIRACGGDREKGIEAFLKQNDGEGWMLPETLRLADYGLGHDERAKQHQPVASRLGPRFYDWQLAQSAEESWRECHLHARNLLGEAGYRQLLDEIEAEKRGEKPNGVAEAPVAYGQRARQGRLFE